MSIVMGKVTEELISLIKKQINDHGIVVWYDPEEAYTEVVETMELPGVNILRRENGFFELRHRLEPFLEFIEENGSFKDDFETPPKVLVYIPMNRADARHALIEAECAGAVMEPGASHWRGNTRLKVLAERIFREIAPDRVGEIAAEVEAGRRSLAELDWLADQTGELGAVKLIFGTSAVADVTLSFLNSDELDRAVRDKHARAELTGLFEKEFGFDIDPNQPVEQIRSQLAQSLILADLGIGIGEAGGNVPELANIIEKPETGDGGKRITEICRQWRNRLDLHESYASFSDKTWNEAQIAGLDLQPEFLQDIETFSNIETLLLEWTESRILEGLENEALKVIDRRKGSFWSLYQGEFQLRWTILEIACRLLQAAGGVRNESKKTGNNPGAWIEAYTGDKGDGKERLPWFMLDRFQRRLENRYAMLDYHMDGRHDTLEKVIRRVREQYAEAVGKCAEKFASALKSSNFELEGWPAQDDIFIKQVRSCMAEGKTAYFLVDALRYEMCDELLAGLGEGFEAELKPCIAQLPTITEVGMAALMPGAEKGMELKHAGSGRVGVVIDGKLLKNRASRIKHFENALKEKSAVFKLTQIVKPGKKVRQEIEDADIILITSWEIDRRGEEIDDKEDAGRFMDEVLEKLRRGIRRLGSLGVKRVIIAADHGYIFADEPAGAMKIDPPGGKTIDLHGRVWIGKGGMAAPGYIRLHAADIGLSGDMELAFPLGLARFKTKGPDRGFFHGGISLQEMIVPAAVIKVKTVETPGMGRSSVLLKPAKPRITTRFFSIEAKYVSTGLFEAESEKRVRIVVRSNRSEVGHAAMATHGFEEGTGEILMEKDRAIHVTMMLSGDIKTDTVSVHVLDAVTRVELGRLKNIPVEISI